MSTLDWNRSIEEVLGDDATAQRQLDEHAQLLPIASGGRAARFMLARLDEHRWFTLATMLVNIGSAAGDDE